MTTPAQETTRTDDLFAEGWQSHGMLMQWEEGGKLRSPTALLRIDYDAAAGWQVHLSDVTPRPEIATPRDLTIAADPDLSAAAFLSQLMTAMVAPRSRIRRLTQIKPFVGTDWIIDPVETCGPAWVADVQAHGFDLMTTNPATLALWSPHNAIINERGHCYLAELEPM